MIRVKIRKRKKMIKQQIISLPPKMGRSHTRLETLISKDKSKDGPFLKDMHSKKEKYYQIQYFFQTKQF
jgi:hypothetical protein